MSDSPLRWRLLLGLGGAVALAVVLEGVGLALAAGGVLALALLGPLRRAGRERAESLRREEEARALLDTLLELSPVGLAFLDAELRCVRANAALAAMDGVPEG